MSNNTITWVMRTLLGLLTLFELMGWTGVISFTVQFTWRGLVITSLVAIALLEIIAYRYAQLKRLTLHWSVWLALLVTLLFDAAGDMFFLYNRFNWWDQTAHFFVSAVACFTLFVIINAFLTDPFSFKFLWRSQRSRLASLLAFTCTLSLGVLYEIEEYLEDSMYGTSRLGPGTDTANDLLNNSLGALMVILLITIYYFIFHKKRKRFL